MKLNDFIQIKPVERKSNYKVVVGNSPKEQELTKEADKVEGLSGELQQLQESYDKVEEENDFLKGQVKRTQSEIDEARGKVVTQQTLQLELVQKENQMTLIQEEMHELAIKEQRHSETIKQLQLDLNNKTGEWEVLQQKHNVLTKDSELITSKYNGLHSDFSRVENFSEKIQNDYNKVGERNTVLLNEREELSKLKAEFEAKSIRLGEELIRAHEKIRDVEGKLADITNTNESIEKEAIASNNLHSKLRADLRKLKLQTNNLDPNSKQQLSFFDKLYKTTTNFLDNKNQIKVNRETKERLESMEWNVAKQELKLGNASTYPNKLGFGSSTFFKLNDEENIKYG